MASRLVFGIVALHGGGLAIAHLSGRLELHAAATWSTALLVMALGEVVSRTMVLTLKYCSALREL